ncbi:DUF4344 domain-containing metallopeptidase [Dongia sp.]|uniref:DUF4344 domain-containing metallopeptidase n=1 Tax=Dongia sp. TaxID=1977262 RepID=UPI0035AE5F03
MAGLHSSWRRLWALMALIAAAQLWQGPANAAEIDDDVILGALVAEFHLSVAGSLLPDAGTGDGTINAGAVAGAVQLIALTGVTEAPQGPDSADLGKALDAFLAFAATLEPTRNPPLSAKLAREFACQLIGTDPVGHAALGSTLKIDAAAAKACANEAEKAAADWNARLAPFRKGPGLTPPEGAGPLYVEIAPVIDAANEAIAAALKSNRLYDNLAERLNAELALPYGRMLLVTECGGPNAFFNPDRREIVLCDERIAAWIAAQKKS